MNGQLDATFNQLAGSDPIELQSVNGSVTLVIPSDANASLTASTVHGGISNDFGLQVRDGEYVGHSLEGQIGSGGPRIKLGNVNGAIRITHAQDGRVLSPVTSMTLDEADKDKEKDKAQDKEKNDLAREINEQVSREVDAATAAREVDSARVAREAQREVEVAMREAQLEMIRAQAEIQRETSRQVREQLRMANSTVKRVRVGRVNDSRFSNQETKSFTLNGPAQINVNTFDGPVTVHGWDKSEVSYTATKRAADEGDLKEITIDAQQQGGTVLITARSSDIQNGSAEFELYVPRRATLHVASDDGQLTLDGVSGDITLRTGDGAIEVSNGGGQLQLNTGDGRIRVATFEGSVDARTGDGPISLDGNFKSLSARTGDGSISLIVPAGSNFTVETGADNEINNEGLILAEDITPSQRVKRWRVGSGGKIFVLNTGEGRIVLRTR
ncbi:MAG: DUF4097 family beta strand repeat-containing protein [Pyrinomonadaceae bacterium]